MVKSSHNGKRDALGTVAHNARARCSAYVMKPEYLAGEIKRFDEFKNSEEGRRVMCKAMERIEARGEARGKREGKRETMLATAKRMLKDGILALKDIARYSGLSLVQVKKFQASMA